MGGMTDERDGPQATSLFKGFEGYRTPKGDDYGRVLTHGLVVIDTNVLLNLYRYRPEARSDLLSVLAKLGDRLWVPHQVLVEFWRNRESAIRDPEDSAEETIEALDTHVNAAIKALRTWANRVAAPQERVTELIEELRQAFGSAKDVINESVDPDELNERRDTNRDALLQDLATLVNGRVGPPFGPEEHETAAAEGLRRLESRILLAMRTAANLPPRPLATISSGPSCWTRLKSGSVTSYWSQAMSRKTGGVKSAERPAGPDLSFSRN